MKVLALCDSPTLGSGFARVAQNLFQRWHASAVDIDVFGIGFVGWGYKRIHYVDQIFPAGNDWHQPHRLDLFLAQLSSGHYTHVWLMQDTFMLSQHGFPERLREICQRRKLRSMLYFPVDAPLESEWTDIIAAVDVPVAYTEYGKREAETKGRLRGHGFVCEVLPHGVDTDVFRPLHAPALPHEQLRARLRETLWQQQWIGPDDFLILNVNANQRRKDVARCLEILAGLRQRGVPAKLLMHMPESSYEGLSLESVASQLGLVQLRDWAHHGAYFRRGNPLLSEAELAKYYNAADLYLTTSLGEGWGLGITEALACGCPAALPQHTACYEIFHRFAELGAAQAVLPLPLEPSGVVLEGDNSRMRRRVDVVAAVELLCGYYHSKQWQQRLSPLPEPIEQWLSWPRIAGTMLRMLKRPHAAGLDRPRRYYLEFGGGLGDVFHSMYHRGAYNVLRDLQPGERAEVVLCSHNPFVCELFEWHPKRDQIELRDLGYWHGVDADREARQKHNLPLPGANARLPEKDANIEFCCRPEDDAFIQALGDRPVVVLALAAGLPDRNIPRDLIEKMVPPLLEAGFTLVNTGRTYERHARREELLNLYQNGVIDGVDHLSVPGVAKLLQASAGLVTCHSALNLLAWHLRKPQLLLYPKSAYERHIRHQDQWAFGIDYPETVHALFENFKPEDLSRFIRICLGKWK